MSTATDYFGFEALQKLVENQVHKKEDIIVLFSHWFFVKGGFRCIGSGDSKVFSADEIGSELLPKGWSENNHYALRYSHEGLLYILLGRKSDGDLLLNLLRIADNSLSTIKFPVNSTVAELHGPLANIIPNHQEAYKKIQKELVEPVCTSNAREISTQTTAFTREDENGGNQQGDGEEPRRIEILRDPRRRLWDEGDPRRVGRRDLDPFAGVGPHAGGMIYDPFNRVARGLIDPLGPRPGGLGGPIRIPPGAIPPGARFDPFGPPDVVQPRPRRFDPDGEHPPPGFDDLFM